MERAEGVGGSDKSLVALEEEELRMQAERLMGQLGSEYRRTTTVRTPPAAALDTTVSDGGSRSPLAWLARRRSVTSSIASDSKYNRSPPAAPSAPGSVSVTRNTRWITSASFDSVELIAAKTPPPREGTPGEDTAECGEI